MSLAQSPTLMHQQACVVVTLASTLSLKWSDQTASTSAAAPLVCPVVNTHMQYKV